MTDTGSAQSCAFHRFRPRQTGIVLAAIISLSVAIPDDALARQAVQFDQSTLAMERPAMATLLEKTIFKVDVAWLELWFTPDVLRRMRRLAEEGTGGHRDSIAALATGATDVFARLHFERNVSLEQFLDGLQGSARKARDAGIVTEATYQDIVTSSPEWYAFLEGRGIHDGDEMMYRIRGDTLRTVYQAADGTILLDQRDVGAERRLAVLGGYLAPGSDFRDGLLESALQASRAPHSQAGHPSPSGER